MAKISLIMSDLRINKNMLASLTFVFDQNSLIFMIEELIPSVIIKKNIPVWFKGY